MQFMMGCEMLTKAGRELSSLERIRDKMEARRAEVVRLQQEHGDPIEALGKLGDELDLIDFGRCPVCGR